MNTTCTDPGMVEALVYGRAAEWEKHELGSNIRFVKPLAAHDPMLKAKIAQRYDELGFVPHFFKEHGHDFVALEGVKRGRYSSVEQAFVEQILGRIRPN